ncbi:MAG TPA: TPM domain-containing protein [Candidatus Nitrosotalea sp.]|nr:TPM domain-containing protein [Candidatus Nitrosotalea sp.]
MRRFYGLGVLFLLVAALPQLALGQDFKVPPKPDHYVTDNADALSSGARSSIEDELHAYEQSTGHQVIVWIGDTTGDVPLETFTGDTARAWKVGRKGHDDGAILFLFMSDHKVRIEVGYGLESSLTDADSHRIIQDVIVPRMRAGKIDDAVSGGVAAILKTITPAYSAVSAPPAASEGNASPAVTAFILGIFAIFGVVIIFVIITIILRVIYAVRYGYLILREGPKKAKSDMKTSAFWSGAAGGLISSSSFGGGDSGGDFGGGFDAGGGDFGGGGASGSW